MTTSTTVQETRAVRYELAIDIAAPPQRVWESLREETDLWWPRDFRMAGADSKVTFDARAGGCLREEHADGGSLLWFTVLSVSPAKMSMELTGHITPDYGGPMIAQLKLQVDPGGKASVLRISEALIGHIKDSSLESLHEGWRELFTKGLKAHVE